MTQNLEPVLLKLGFRLGIDRTYVARSMMLDGIVGQVPSTQVAREETEALLDCRRPQRPPNEIEPPANSACPRLSIRPFTIADLMRHDKKPMLDITWDKNCGKDVEWAPWFEVFKGDRIYNHHPTLAGKQAARGREP